MSFGKELITFISGTEDEIHRYRETERFKRSDSTAAIVETKIQYKLNFNLSAFKKKKRFRAVIIFVWSVCPSVCQFPTDDLTHSHTMTPFDAPGKQVS